MIDPKTRRQSLGASEWAAVLGISPFSDAYKVFASKTGSDSGSFFSPRMADGNDTENFVLNLAEKRLPLVPGTKIVGQQVRIAHHTESWATATLDAIAEVIIGDQKVSAVVEAKTISANLYNAIPDYYLIQVLVQMWCCGLEHGYLVVWSTKETKFKSFLIEMKDHQAWFDECLAKVKGFWMDYVLKGIAPERVEIVREKTTEIPTELIEEYLVSSEKEKFWKERKDKFKEQIMEVIGPDQKEYRIKTTDYQLDMTWVASKRLDTDRLKAEQGDLVAPYYSESGSHRFALKRTSPKLLQAE
jgi:putative phage-type endonuclease